MAEDIIVMVETPDRGSLRGLRNRAMLLIGFAGGFRRSESVGLDLRVDQTEDGRGWIEILDKGRSLGFQEIAPYYEAPLELRNHLIFMEAALAG